MDVEFLDKMNSIVNLYDLLVVLHEEIEPHQGKYMLDFEEDMTGIYVETTRVLQRMNLTKVSKEEIDKLVEFLNSKKDMFGKAMVSLYKGIVSKHCKMNSDLLYDNLNNVIPFTEEEVTPLNSHGFRSNYHVYPLERSFLFDLISPINWARQDYRLGIHLGNLLT